MLEESKCKLLVSLLTETDDFLCEINDRFNESFSFDEKIIALKDLSLLIVDFILESPQQIVAFWILYKSFHVESIGMHPFLPIFDFIQDTKQKQASKFSPQLYHLVALVLTGESIDFVSDKSTKDIFSSEFSMPIVVSTVPSSPTNFTRIPSVLIDETPTNQTDVLPFPVALVQLLQSPSYTMDFTPNFRQEPPLSPIFDEEMQDSFVSALDQIPFVFDDNK